MHQHLYKFLILYRRLNIPQVGNFSIEDEQARIDTDSGLLFAPKPVIRFRESSAPQHPDKIFFHFLAEELLVDEIAAIREFHEYCFTFRNNIQEHRMAALGGIGRITRRSEGDLFFTPENNLLELLPPVPWSPTKTETRVEKPPKRAKEVKQKESSPEEPAAIEEIITEETEETVPSDRWWIYAILLLAAGVLALLFYYQ